MCVLCIYYTCINTQIDPPKGELSVCVCFVYLLYCINTSIDPPKGGSSVCVFVYLLNYTHPRIPALSWSPLLLSKLQLMIPVLFSKLQSGCIVCTM